MNITAKDATKSITLDKQDLWFFKKYGYLLLPNCIEADLTQKIKEEIQFITNSAHGQKTGKLIQTTQYLKDMALNDLINSPNLTSVVESILNNKACIYMPFTAIKSANGGGDFHFHQDNQYTCLDKPALNCWFAFSDMTPENGCLGIVPESHLEGTYDFELSPDGDSHRITKSSIEHYAPIRMHPGDCVIFDRNTVHGSGKNTTAENRIAYAIQFYSKGSKGKRHNETEWRDIETNPYFNINPVETLSFQGTPGDEKY